MKTEPVTAEADVTVYVRLLCIATVRGRAFLLISRLFVAQCGRSMGSANIHTVFVLQKLPNLRHCCMQTTLSGSQLDFPSKSNLTGRVGLIIFVECSDSMFSWRKKKHFSSLSMCSRITNWLFPNILYIKFSGFFFLKVWLIYCKRGSGRRRAGFSRDWLQ